MEPISMLTILYYFLELRCFDVRYTYMHEVKIATGRCGAVLIKCLKCSNNIFRRDVPRYAEEEFRWQMILIFYCFNRGAICRSICGFDAEINGCHAGRIETIFFDDVSFRVFR